MALIGKGPVHIETKKVVTTATVHTIKISRLDLIALIRKSLNNPFPTASLYIEAHGSATEDEDTVELADIGDYIKFEWKTVEIKEQD